jgi:flagella synthesis protein FlgN
MNTLHRDLEDLLTQIVAELRQMQRVLEQEGRGLKDRNADLVESSARAKQTLAQKLDALAGHQEVLLRSQNLPAGKEGMERLLSGFPPTDPSVRDLMMLWKDLQHSAAHCRKLNEANGAYIGLLRQHVQRSLDIIHGQPAHGLVYGPDGVGRRPTASRKLLSV